MSYPLVITELRQFLSVIATFNMDGSDEATGHVVCYIKPTKQTGGLPIEIVGARGIWTYFIGDKVIAETNTADADAEIRAIVWLLAVRGAVECLVGRKRYLAVGAYEGLIDAKRGRKKVKIITSYPAWAVGAQLDIPDDLTESYQNFAWLPISR